MVFNLYGAPFPRRDDSNQGLVKLRFSKALLVRERPPLPTPYT